MFGRGQYLPLGHGWPSEEEDDVVQIFPKVQGVQLLVLASALRNLPGTHAKQYTVLQSSTNFGPSHVVAQPEAVPSKVAELPPLQSNAVFAFMVEGNPKFVNFGKRARSGTVPVRSVCVRARGVRWGVRRENGQSEPTDNDEKWTNHNARKLTADFRVLKPYLFQCRELAHRRWQYACFVN